MKTILKSVLGLFLIGILVLPFLPSLEMSRGEARQAQCKIHLRRIGIALNAYASMYGAFPPAYTVNDEGQPLHSWRTLILPFLGEEQAYKQINLSKPWDDPENAAIRDLRLFTYTCPESVLSNRTNYLAVITPESFLRATEPAKLSEATDGPQNTITVIEVSPKDAVEWMEPSDADEAMLHRTSNDPKLNHYDRMHVALLDGSVTLLTRKTSRETIHAMITAAGNDTVKKSSNFRFW